MSDDRRTYWQTVYETKAPADVSWFRPHLETSLALLKRGGLSPASRVIDVGGGASTLVDDLLDLKIHDVTVLDISAASMERAKERLGSRAASVRWMAADVAHAKLPPASVDLWHDRAVLHFLVDTNDAAAYVHTATDTIAAGGFAVIGGFASDGPEKCSGLPVVRRDPEEIAALFGSPFALIDSRRELHTTPWGTSQSFAYALLARR